MLLSVSVHFIVVIFSLKSVSVCKCATIIVLVLMLVQ